MASPPPAGLRPFLRWLFSPDKRTVDEPRTFYSNGQRLWGAWLAVFLAVLLFNGALFHHVPDGDAALLALLGLACLATSVQLTRTGFLLTDAELVVRGLLRTHRFPWTHVAGFVTSPDANNNVRVAVRLDDGSRQALWAVTARPRGAFLQQTLAELNGALEERRSALGIPLPTGPMSAKPGGSQERWVPLLAGLCLIALGVISYAAGWEHGVGWQFVLGPIVLGITTLSRLAWRRRAGGPHNPPRSGLRSRR